MRYVGGTIGTCSGAGNKGTLNTGHFFNKDSDYCPSYIEMCTKVPLKSGHVSNEDSVYCPSYIEMCTKLPLKSGHLSNEDSAYCPRYVHRDVYKTTSEIRTLGPVPSCPKGVLTRELPL